MGVFHVFEIVQTAPNRANEYRIAQSITYYKGSLVIIAIIADFFLRW